MTSPITNIAGSPEVGPTGTAQALSGGLGVSAHQSAQGATPTKPVQDPPGKAAAPVPEPASADLRLVIEDDKAAGCFVYKIVDRKTGEVVQQLPQEQIVKLREADGYLAGDVISAKA